MAEAFDQLPPRECRRRAQLATQAGDSAAGLAWAVLAVAGDLAELRRELRAQGRR